MRNNVKVVAPAIVEGLGIIPNGLFLAMKAPFHDVILKQSQNPQIKILGKGKTALSADWIEQVVHTFCQKEGVEASYDVEITSKAQAYFPFYHKSAVTAGLLTALTAAYRLGHYEMDLFEYYKSLFDNENEKAAFYTAFSGGMVTGLPAQDLYQKVYTPNGLAFVIIESEGTLETPNIALAANVLLAISNTNFKKMQETLSTYNQDDGLYPIFSENNGFGLLSIDEKSKLAIFKNTMDAQGFIAALGDKKYIETSIENEGIVLM